MPRPRHLFLIPLSFLLSGCLNPVKELYPTSEQQRPIPVYVVRLGWHAGLAFEARYLKSQLPDHDRWPDTRYLMTGWGDDMYYPAGRMQLDLFLRAALLYTGSVIHIVGFNEEVEAYFQDSEIIRIQLSRQGMKAMTRYIAEQFAGDKEGNLRYAAPGLYEQSVFFQARELYYFPRTSNWWTAKMLRQSGFPITPFYAITAGNVMQQAGKSGRRISNR